MGRLVLADRHERRLVDDDVGGLQDRVGQQAVVDVIGLVLLLLLVRRRALEPADRRDRREQPGELGVLRDGGSGRTACSAPGRARARAARRPSRASAARSTSRVVRCSSARGSRRCSRSPRTRTGAGRSCGSRRGRCRGGRRPRAGCRRRSAVAAGGASDAGGRGGDVGRHGVASVAVTTVLDRARRAAPARGSVASATIRRMSRPRPAQSMTRAPAARRRAWRRDRRPRGRPRPPRPAR